MPSHFQVGDRVITVAVLPEIAQGTVGTVVRALQSMFDTYAIYDVQFDGHRNIYMVMSNVLAAAPPELGEQQPKVQSV